MKTKLIRKPIYPKQPNYHNISSKEIDKYKHLNKNKISVDEFENEILSILKNEPNAENFSIVKHPYYNGLCVQYKVIEPLSKNERLRRIKLNEEKTKKFELQVIEYNKELEKFNTEIKKLYNEIH